LKEKKLSTASHGAVYTSVLFL